MPARVVKASRGKSDQPLVKCNWSKQILHVRLASDGTVKD